MTRTLHAEKPCRPHLSFSVTPQQSRICEGLEVGAVTGCKEQRRLAFKALSEQSKGNNCGHLQRQCIGVSQGPGASSARHGVNFTPRSRAAPRDLSEAHLPQRCALWPGTPAPGRSQSVLLPHLPGRPSLHRWEDRKSVV